jgi:hypothetical protein
MPAETNSEFSTLIAIGIRNRSSESCFRFRFHSRSYREEFIAEARNNTTAMHSNSNLTAIGIGSDPMGIVRSLPGSDEKENPRTYDFLKGMVSSLLAYLFAKTSVRDFH